MKFNVEELKAQIVEICHLMHRKGFVCATDGNVSVKLSDDKFLITASGINKGLIRVEDIIIINKEAKVIEGNRKYKPTSEWRMHLKAYDVRGDINAVIHAHPPCIVAHTIAGVRIPADILPETVLAMGDIPLTEYAPPTSPKNALIIEKHIKDYDAVVLNRHGSITVGKDLYSAYNKLEKIEHTAVTGILAKILGGCNPLPAEEIKKLLSMGKDMGLLSDKIIKEKLS